MGPTAHFRIRDAFSAEGIMLQTFSGRNRTLSPGSFMCKGTVVCFDVQGLEKVINLVLEILLSFSQFALSHMRDLRSRQYNAEFQYGRNGCNLVWKSLAALQITKLRGLVLLYDTQIKYEDSWYTTVHTPPRSISTLTLDAAVPPTTLHNWAYLELGKYSIESSRATAPNWRLSTKVIVSTIVSVDIRCSVKPISSTAKDKAHHHRNPNQNGDGFIIIKCSQSKTCLQCCNASNRNPLTGRSLCYKNRPKLSLCQPNNGTPQFTRLQRGHACVRNMFPRATEQSCLRHVPRPDLICAYKTAFSTCRKDWPASDTIIKALSAALRLVNTRQSGCQAKARISQATIIQNASVRLRAAVRLTRHSLRIGTLQHPRVRAAQQSNCDMGLTMLVGVGMRKPDDQTSSGIKYRACVKRYRHFVPCILPASTRTEILCSRRASHCMYCLVRSTSVRPLSSNREYERCGPVSIGVALFSRQIIQNHQCTHHLLTLHFPPVHSKSSMTGSEERCVYCALLRDHAIACLVYSILLGLGKDDMMRRIQTPRRCDSLRSLHHAHCQSCYSPNTQVVCQQFHSLHFPPLPYRRATAQCRQEHAREYTRCKRRAVLGRHCRAPSHSSAPRRLNNAKLERPTARVSASVLHCGFLLGTMLNSA
eukprot:IDg22120t1